MTTINIAPDLPQSWLDALAHPRFVPAARALAWNMLRACDEDVRLAAVFKDAGRYLTAMCAAHLDGMGGLTQPQLRRICAGSGFLSPGRARTLLQFLQHLDYVRPAPGETRPLRYLPTPRFVTGWRRHLELALLAASLMEPRVDRLLARFDQPGVYQAFLGVQAGRLLALSQGVDPFPVMRPVFLHPYAGSQILWILLTAGETDAYPAEDAVPVVLAQLARRFGVTPLQVRRVMQRAEQEHLLRYDRRGSARFEEPGKAILRLYAAFQLAELIACAEETLAGLAEAG